ncbi:hypothetical protein [Planococcus glaciei]|uniref:Uncharacterized protein n=1 Tax=Planococcus glaciei TaxID=459472 RepID=A0A7H8QB73_9BACL|nr:hypothetical protein [Planococcus glaciei]MBX0315236.1 hypothetical protein [Planococcus glaciei]QDY45864.1 hypothetical protein FK545_11770 [Planococcus glaciei]QKX51109.1 hypothetical protein HF394_11200 [Planococcus glaciei]
MKTLSKYEQNLQSDDPFIRNMYEDLEKRIQVYEDSENDKTEHAQWKDAAGVILVMSLITIFLVATVI